VTPPSVQVAADALAGAQTSGKPCSPVNGLLAGDLGSAYAVQRLNLERRLAGGAQLVGRKVGLTSPTVQRQLGVEQPDFGALLSDMQVADGGTVPAGRLLQPKVEAEVAVVLGSDLTGPDLAIGDVVAAVRYAVAALEIVDSRIAGWEITLADTVADNASSGMFVLGSEQAALSTLDLRAARMSLLRDGVEVSAGTGADCLDSPLNAALWLARTLVAVGDPLRAGDVVLTGALGPMVAAEPGSTFEARISGLGSVSVAFAPDGAAEEVIG
jgi:2-keto-4-pentenoate hydratase